MLQLHDTMHVPCLQVLLFAERTCRILIAPAWVHKLSMCTCKVGYMCLLTMLVCSLRVVDWGQVMSLHGACNEGLHVMPSLLPACTCHLSEVHASHRQPPRHPAEDVRKI